MVAEQVKTDNKPVPVVFGDLKEPLRKMSISRDWSMQKITRKAVREYLIKHGFIKED